MSFNEKGTVSLWIVGYLLILYEISRCFSQLEEAMAADSI
jgi:hypothetical protein